MKSDASAVILDLSETGYATAKCLGDEVDILGVHTTKYSPIAHKSNFVNNSIVAPNKSYEQTLEFLLEHAKNFEVPATIFVASDPMVEFISKFGNELKPFYHVPDSDRYDLGKIMSKKEMAKVAETAGVKVPKQDILVKGGSVDRVIENATFPAFVKPENSLEGYKDMMGIAKDKDELKKLIDDKLNYCTRILVTEYIPGEVTDLFEAQGFILPDGTPYTPVVIQKIRQYPDMLVGSGTFLQTVNNPELRRLSDAFLKELNLNGPVDIDFKRNSLNGQYYFIEANYRISGNVDVSRAAGANIPMLFHQSRTGGLGSLPQAQQKVQWVDEGRDWKHVIEGTLSEQELFNSYTNVGAFAYFNSKDRNVFNNQFKDESHPFFKRFKEELKLNGR